jgi:hypothetical protein
VSELFSAWIDAMGWMLVHSLWLGAAVALALALALRLLCRASARARYPVDRQGQSATSSGRSETGRSRGPGVLQLHGRWILLTPPPFSTASTRVWNAA